MHLIALGLVRFAEYMSSVYIDEEFDREMYEEEEGLEYIRRQVSF